MNNIQIRIPNSLTRELFDSVTRHGPRESVAFGLVSHVVTEASEIILLHHLRIPPDRAFLRSGNHGARWKGSYTIELLNEAMGCGLGLFIFHFHYGANVRMSTDDIRSARELLPKFQLVCPDRPHASVVLGTNSFAGIILRPNTTEFRELFALRLFAEKIIDLPPIDVSRKVRERFERQPLVHGPVLEAILEQARITVIGQSGGGTHVSLQLAQHGFQKICGIDDDVVDRGNKLSGLGFSKQDVVTAQTKVAVLSKTIAQIAPSVNYTPLKRRVPETEAVEKIKTADIIIGCVNNLHARADLQELALRFLIPYVDIGLVLTTDPESREEFPAVRSISGNIFTYIPGGPCMWCTGFLSDEKLAEETQHRGRHYLQTKDSPDVHVLSFNGLLASQAVSEVLNLLTGFGNAAGLFTYRKFDGFKGSLLPCLVRKNPGCPKCSQYLAAGSPVWSPIRSSVLSNTARSA